MRLLRRKLHGDFELVTYNTDDLPPYAILSHTWTEGEEVTYDELLAGTGKDKAGYAKIRFCSQRAAQDGLDYFWVDTCCINKSTSDEVSTAINSMFRWYQRASKCYVYLSDVLVPDETIDVQASGITWEDAFRRSRWFTRGWTLQELLAPATVEFFSNSGKRLGSKISLEQEVYEVTKIPIEALRGRRLSEFSVEERMAWAANRKTTLKEDRVYCLLGIFGVFLPLIYGEGEEHASLRLREEVQKRQKGKQTESLQDLPDVGNYRTPFNLQGVPVASPINVAGAGGAILGIIDVITRSIATLHDLQSQVADVNFIVSSITTQLTALRAALANIWEWVDSESVETHHQLVMDLGNVLSCCGMLMDRLNAEVSKLQADVSARVNIKAKFKAAFNGKSIHNLQSMIERQTSALNLLITAYSCKTIAKQRSLLEKPRSRKTFRRIDNDVASLYVHRDSDSFVSRLTDTLTKISRDFVFDRLLWESKVYKDASPGLLELMRERVRRQESARLEERHAARSKTIDEQLTRESSVTRSAIKALVIGKDKSQVNTFINAQMMNPVRPQRHDDAEDIQNVIRRAVTTLVDMSQTFVLEKQLVIEDYFAKLDVESQTQTSTDRTKARAQGLRSLWSNETFKAAMLEEEDYFPGWADWVVQRANQITGNDYVPSVLDDHQATKIASELDYVMNRQRMTREAKVYFDSREFHLIGIATEHEIMKWIHHFDNVTLLIFIVDLSYYDEDPFVNRLIESITLFNRLVNHRAFQRTSIILVLANYQAFKLKISHMPLRNYFPDYSGGCDVISSVQYIHQRFVQCNRAMLRIHLHLGETDDFGLTSLTINAAKQTFLENELWSYGLS